MAEPLWIRAANRLLSPWTIRLLPDRPAPAESWREGPGGEYLSDRAALRRAGRAGLSIGSYREKVFGKPGRAVGIVERMSVAGALGKATRRILEVGPGTGIFTEAVLEKARPAHYEIYEVDRRRATRLQRALGVVVRAADGCTLSATPDDAIDLVHAHGLLVELDFLVSHLYLEEMARVVGRDGWIVLDVVSEECLGDADLRALLAGAWRAPNFLPKRYVVDLLRRRGLDLAGEFSEPLLECGHSRYLLFRRTGAAAG